MAGLITVRLQRNDAQPWGFRLQGGKDFGTPLLIQKVNGGSLAEKAGLQVADAVIKVNGQDVYNLRHKDAQDSIVKAGNSMEVVVSRSPGGTWKPNVTPVGNIPAPSPVGGAPAAVTKTSLAYKGPPAPTIPGYNNPAKPFSPQFNGVGADPASVKSITSKQYNNPVGLYSDQTIAETLSAQAEVLAGGVLGVNFMKNEKTKFDASHSEVLKLVQEIDSEPKTPEPVEPVSPGGGLVAPPPVSMPGVKHVVAPENKPPSTTSPQTPLQPGQNICADCERLIIHMVGGRATSPRPLTPMAQQMGGSLPTDRYPASAGPVPESPKCSECSKIIVGVFVRIKDKNLHVDCFKCATCGTSLKNVGYYNINNKLYCDIHAKLVARANPPAPNLDPITIPPGGPLPSGTLPAPLPPAGPTSPQPGTLAPLPFHPPPSNAAPPKPFGAPAAPAQFSAPAAPPQFSAPAAPPQFSAPAPSVKAAPGKPFSSVQFNPPSAPAPAPFSAPPPAPFSSAPAPPSSFPKTLPGQIPSKPLGKKGQSELSHSTSQSYTEKTKGQSGEIEDISCCMDKSKRMSVCSSEVCNLSEKRSAVKAMAPLMEDPVRASPVPFNKGEVVSESFGAVGQETLRKSENVETSEEGNVHITRKTKVEESFVRSQKMYSAEISSSQSAVQMRAASPELEQIMMRKHVYQSYDTAGLTPQQKQPQSERCLTPEIESLMEKPHGSWSPMPPACMVRPISPHAIISYPPDMPSIHHSVPQPRIATPEQFQEARETVERFVDHSKHVQQSQAVTQSYLQQSSTQQQQQQQYTPRYDMSESFSAYNVRGSAGNGYSNGTAGNAGNQNGHNIGNPHNPGTNVNPGNPHNSGNPGNPGNHGNGNPGNHGNGNPGNHGNGNPGNHGNGNPGNHGNGNPGNHGNGNPGNHGNGNPGNHGNGNPGNHGNGNPGKNNSDNNGQAAGNGNPGNKGDEENPTVTEPDDSEEKYSRKSSGQSQKSKKSTSEEESSRRVFTDFGGPQVMTSLNVESTTEGGVEKTSVTKSEKMEYSSCEFESTRKSTILQDNRGNEEGKSSSGESRKQSYPKFTATEASVDEEESVTKSQVEQIIQQELNKVFQMAQAMDKTNLNEMYDQRSQQSSHTTAQVSAVKATDKSSQKVDQTVSSSQYSEKKSFSGEVITKTGKLTSGLTIAPDRSFTPQPLESNYPLTYQNIPSDFPPPRFPPGEPKPETKPGYIPITGSRDSPLLNALTIAPDRPYSPLPTATVVETPAFITAPKPQGSSMLEALTTAPSIPFTFGESNLLVEESSTVQRTTKSKQESIQKYAPKPSQDDFKPISTFEPDSYSKYASLGQSVERSTVKSYQPVTDELKSAFSSTSKVQSQRHESEIQQSVKSHQTSLSASRIERSLTPSGLHPPDLLPYYQRNIGEIPLAHRSNSPVPHQIKAPELKPPRPDSVPHPTTERRGSVKALSEAYNQQIEALNNKYQPTPTDISCSSVSYVSAGAYSSGSVTKAYSYEQDHKSIDAMGYHPSPLAGKRTPLAGERTIPKCSSPVLGKLDHTKQVFKPSVPAQQSRTFQSPIAEQASLRQAPPFFTQEKEKPQTPWVVVKEEKENVSAASFRLPLPPKPTSKPSLPTFPLVNKASALPEPPKPPSVLPDAGPGGAKGAATAGTTAPRRGRGVLNAAVGAGARVPLCGSCNNQIRGPFITALGKIWCPDHFVCVNAQCRRPLQDIGFVEEEKGLYCEYCFEQYLAPACNKCNAKIKGDCLNAIGKHFHPECFTCAYCGKLFGNSPFFLEDALPYCEADWNELFTTKCFSCGFPIEAGDRWVEALNNNYHSQCFSCTMCKKNLEGQSFFAKGGRPFCKNHAR